MKTVEASEVSNSVTGPVLRTVKAGKVRKGQLILIEGKVGPRLVTKREKWNKTYCRVYYAEPVMHFMDPPRFEYFRLDHVLKIYDPRVTPSPNYNPTAGTT